MIEIINTPFFIVLTSLTLLNLVLVLVLFWRLFTWQRRMRELVSGEEVSTLPEIVRKQKRLLSNHGKNLRELGKLLEELVENNRFNIQKISLIRFNPFREVGGNMSFTIALLDGYDSGIVISSLHGREGVRVYTKPIKHGASDLPLTEEEKSAIAQAKKNKPSNI